MGSRFKFRDGIEVTVDLAAPDDIDARVAAYTPPADGTPLHDISEVYARATYLKYRTASRDFGVVASTAEDLGQRMSPPVPRPETLVLIEATRTDTNQIIGAALLRFAWTGDLVFDFVGTNPNTRGAGGRKLENIGSMLIYEGLRLAKSLGANEVFAETAGHSHEWWHNHLAQGSDLIKASSVNEALEATRAIFTGKAKISES